MIYVYDYTPYLCGHVGLKVQKQIRKKFLGKFADGDVKVDDIIADIERIVKVSNKAHPKAPQLEVHVSKNFSVIAGRWIIWIKYPRKENATTQDVCCTLFIAEPQVKLTASELREFRP